LERDLPQRECGDYVLAMRTILLVCGSRALDPLARRRGDAASEQWAKDVILERITALPPDSIVLSGRCPQGPDYWAAQEAMRTPGVKLVEFDAQGQRWDNGVMTGTWWQRWCPGWPKVAPGRRPLARNTAMAAAARCMVDKGWRAATLALVAPWSETQGTQHMASESERVGIRADVRTFRRLPPAVPPTPLDHVRRGERVPRAEPEPPPDPPDARVYFVQGILGAIKIGTTTDMPARIDALQTANPEKLKVLGWCPGGHRVERALHRRFARHRIRGEWFRPARELLLMIHRLHFNAATRPRDAREALAAVRSA
jgi:hypothetical protein